MAKRNVIYHTKYEAEVALIFLAAMFIVILFSGCMRDLSPGLDPLVPEWVVNHGKQTCCEKCPETTPVADNRFLLFEQDPAANKQVRRE